MGGDSTHFSFFQDTMLSRRNLLLSSGSSLASFAGLAAFPGLAHADSEHWKNNLDGAETHKASLDGLCWSGTSEQRTLFERLLAAWMATQGLNASLLDIRDHGTHHQALLRTLPEEVGTLNLRERPRLWLGHDILPKPVPGIGSPLSVPTPVVSLKEIFLAFAHPGRATMLLPEHATFATFLAHMQQRQSTALWAQRIGFHWPDGDDSRWNAVHWNKGTPKTRAGTYAAYLDALVNPQKYAVGCYTAAKLALGLGLLDHAYRLNPSAAQQRRTLSALWLNQDPLVGIEPSDIWSFEPGFSSAAPSLPGKTHDALRVDQPRHMIPGDWLYIFNTDAATYAKTGYEGSNAIYLGGGRFSDYYNDHGFSYAFEEKLDDVYQWRNQVFSRQRDFANAKVLTPAQLKALERSPSEGGLLLPWRVSPKMALAMP